MLTFFMFKIKSSVSPMIKLEFLATVKLLRSNVPAKSAMYIVALVAGVAGSVIVKAAVAIEMTIDKN